MFIIDNIKKYINTHIEIQKLEFQEKIEGFVKQIIMLVILICSAMTAVAFVLLALALWLNRLTGLPYMGFLIVALILGIFAFFVFKEVQKNVKP
jgi:hypothetical protein